MARFGISRTASSMEVGGTMEYIIVFDMEG